MVSFSRYCIHAVLPVPGGPHMNRFLARPAEKMSERLEAMRARVFSRQRGVLPGGSDCESRIVGSRSILFFLSSNKGVEYHR